ncbi:adenylyl-sulfate kinase [Ralstonia syzygii subsp. celebesensis]|uniref:Adenylyl-sulfate kinase n=4 Tax=Ralstonia TaxID=48736 RepID=A0AAD0SFT5_RALSL|nr:MULTISPECIES: adenylyl-sulfate kinase [Ralstonia solanacearum species complex]AQW30400.1 adenylyl-sulfate kinase [blood disease bacterium A2-HR MARDI]CCA80966.1 adenylyl-sulfate kinase [blood disease bacterium R229]AXV83347.1 adenylyl-sulfate kinase [Ralstonia solanacearum]AXW54482.1 adenylyl-sulfate kinase [Ralstonia solanacearum]QQV55767.1 adenylyl-sulfate kinase [Ralstonia syzygii subsp. celebesensis]
MQASISETQSPPDTQRFAFAPSEAFTIWMTGLSGAGKSTLAREIQYRLRQQGRACYVLDGDVLRDGLSSDLGFSREDRCEQVRRVAHVARILNEAGVVAIVALVSPYRADRQLAREIIGAGAMHEVWVCTPLQVCQARDPKGLYRQANAGLLPAMTGVAAPYEPPPESTLRIDTSRHDVSTCANRILDAVGAHPCMNGSDHDVRG